MGKRQIRWYWACCWVGLLTAGAFSPLARAADASADRPAREDGGAAIRFTPGMARAFAGIWVKELVQGKDLPEDRFEEAQEKVARRIMRLAHNIDEPGSELLQRFVEEQLKQQAEGGGHSFMPPGFGKEFADRLLPIMPEIHELIRGVGQDVRPMLPMKQQLKLAAEMMAIKTVVDGFEETMKKWSSGEVTDYRDPFRQEQEVKLDENGQSEELKRARESAQKRADQPRSESWQGYLEEFKQFYGLDEAQQATAESILREFAERETRLLADEQRQAMAYETSLWSQMIWTVPESWMHPMRQLLEDQWAAVREPWEDLEAQFKARLESIPTSAQKRAAESRVAALLEEKGLAVMEDDQ